MHTRWDDALYAQAGACNPWALANSLAKHLRQAADEGGGTDAARSCPACRLITHQLAFLMGQEYVEHPAYETWMREVVLKADPRVVMVCGFDHYLPAKQREEVWNAAQQN